MIKLLLRWALCFPLATCCAAVPQSDSRYAVGTRPGTVAVADFNGDGKLDMVVANEQSANASVLLGDGKGGFAAAPGSPFPTG